MSKNKKLFSTLTALTIGAVAGAGIALSPVAAFAEHEDGKKHADEHSCKGEKGDHPDEKKGEHSCGEKSCDGKK